MRLNLAVGLLILTMSVFIVREAAAEKSDAQPRRMARQAHGTARSRMKRASYAHFM